MSAISWNCRGLGNPCTVKALQKTVLEEDPTLVFLIETKYVVSEMARIKRKLERQQCLVVPSVNRGGGLALLWKNSLTVDVQTYSPRHIDVIVNEENGNRKWRFTGFYGHPETNKHIDSWKLIEQLSKSSDLPWLIMGDFNEIMHLNEKVGGNLRPEWQMRSFVETINKCQLRDLGFIRSEFTWSRRLGPRGWVRERLDRAFVSSNWVSLFPQAKLYHIAASTSDHCMLVLKSACIRQKPFRRKKLFRFESMWLRDVGCRDIVKEAWERGQGANPEHPFSQCLEECRTSLSSWNKSTFGHVGRRIAALQSKLQWLEGRNRGDVNMDEINEVKSELNRMLLVEEDMWHQRSRNCWLKAGDRNTSFFHTKASNRHQRNSISKIRGSNGVWLEDEALIGSTFVEYFEQLFTSSQPTVSDELLEAIQTKVTDRMNSTLLQDFRAHEVEKALKQMHPMKAPGPDGMPPLFYQHFWPIVNPTVIKTVLDFLNHDITPPNFHETHIVLIPKTKNPECVTDYRPISLCNVIYKLASKTVANRLKLIMQEIICENQSAFVSERLITDNVLVAHELMTHINRKKKGKNGEMALKLDMSKAYDRVEWGCLKLIMAKLGFHEDWIRLVMRCVSSVTYAVRINGHPWGRIVPTRGLRQGDPLSPYLFLICAEGLSALLHKAVQNKALRGVAASARGPRISHLFFADDSLIFGRATARESAEIQRVLQIYELSSGQQLNRNKTSIFFSHNTDNGTRETIKTMFGAQVIRSHEAYLGLPSLIGKSKRNTFAHLKQRVANKLTGWKEKLLSNAGKEVLIKAVAQAVPSYTMSCFKLPNSLCEELTSMVRQFWWGQVKEEKKLAWMSWDKMCLSKEKGGMGFRDLKTFNLSLLAKQGWRLQTNPSSLFHRVYKAKYFPMCDFLEANMGRQPSYAWRSLMAAQALVKRGVRWQVGDGVRIQVWKDKWLPNPSTYKVVTPEILGTGVTWVRDIIDEDRMEWRVDLIRQTFMPQDVDAILSIPLSANRARDRLIWAGTKNGKFSVRSAYKMAQETEWVVKGAEPSDPTKLREIWRHVWRMNTPNKLKHFAWKACKNILATKENLKRRNITKDDVCEACGEHLESACHIFWFCDKAKEVWESSKMVLPFEIKPSWDFIDVVWHIQKRKDQCPGLLERIIAICWGIWKNRNEVFHGGKGRVGRAVTRSSLLLLEEFQIVNEGPQVTKGSAPVVVKWRPPRPGCYKVNVDGAVFSKRKQVGIGVVIRDSGGVVVAALSKKMALPLGALETEAKALEEGIQFACDVGVRDVIFESDSLNICNSVQGLSEPPSSVQNIIAGILRQVQSFRTFEFTHTRRQGNVPAHILAQHAAYVEDFSAWLEECPSHIVHECALDVRTVLSSE